MWIYVLEQPITGGTDVIVKYCSLDCSVLANYANTNNISANINRRFIFFDINGLTAIYSIVVENNGNWVDVGHYFATQAEAVNFVTQYSPIYKSTNMKVGTVQVI